jgi:hypothetical protein
LAALLLVALEAGPAEAALLPTNATIGTSANPVCAGRTIVFVSRVSSPLGTPVEPTPFGTVYFADGQDRLGAAPLDNDGVARFAISSLPAGTHRITATYSGDFWYSPSTSRELSQRVAGCGGSPGAPASRPPPPPPLIAAAGDIACGSANDRFNRGLGTTGFCQQQATASLIASRDVSAVLPLGDLQYDGGGTLQSFFGSYDLSWGRWRRISHPAIGNHEYEDPHARGYWDYWNGRGKRWGRAGRRGRGWYSFDLGTWHLVALNSNCGQVSCRGHSHQLKWLRRDLRRKRGHCVLAYMHHPRFSSGLHEEHQDTGRLWNALYRGGADVVLNGHDHIYERFAPQRPDGTRDRRRGITEFTAGTGGYQLFSVAARRARHSQFATSAGFGVLFLRLDRRSFRWSFVDTSGHSVDQGARPCHPGRQGRHKHGGHR